MSGDNPRHDPYLVEAIATLLIYNAGQPVHLTKELDLWPQIVGEAVQVLRRLGFVIEAEQGRSGYTLKGWARPDRWMHLDTVYREHKSVLRVRCHQLTFEEVDAVK